MPAPPLQSLRRNLFVLLVGAGGVLAALLIFRLALYWENQQLSDRFGREAEAFAHAIEARIASIRDETHTLSLIFASPREVPPDEFNALAARVLEHSRMIYGVNWVQRKVEGDKERFVVAMGRLQTGDPLRGFDLTKEPRRFATVRAATDSGQPALSAVVPLNRGGGRGVIMMQPVYAPGQPTDAIAARRAALRGIMVAGIDINHLFDQLPGFRHDHLDFVVRDNAIEGEVMHIHAPRAEGAMQPTVAEIESHALGETVAVQAANHQWTIRFAPSPGFLAEHARQWSLPALALGLSLALTASVLAALLQRRRQRVAELVAQKTAALRLSESRFRDLSGLSADWFWEMDADLRFSYFSGRNDDLMQPYIGKYRWDLPIDLMPEEWEAHKAVLRHRQPFRDFEYRVHHAGDKLRWYSISGIPLFEDGRFVGYRGTGREITARKTLEAELLEHRDHLEDQVKAQTADLLRAKEAAERANIAKSGFLANMSHELRTPMHAILSFARIGHAKADTALPEKLREYFDHIRTSGERLLSLVNDLLDLSKLEAGQMRYSMSSIDLRRLTEEIATELAPLLKAQQIALEIAAEAPDCLVTGDHKRLGQVLQNLLGNAIKFSPAAGTIRVEIAAAVLPAGTQAGVGNVPARRLTVADAGIGIPESELEAIFDKFVQSSKTVTGAGGTGLGLAICREIVNAHRGIIQARNRPEGGAAFDVILPAVTGSQA